MYILRTCIYRQARSPFIRHIFLNQIIIVWFQLVWCVLPSFCSFYRREMWFFFVLWLIWVSCDWFFFHLFTVLFVFVNKMYKYWSFRAIVLNKDFRLGSQISIHCQCVKILFFVENYSKQSNWFYFIPYITLYHVISRDLKPIESKFPRNYFAVK